MVRALAPVLIVLSLGLPALLPIAGCISAETRRELAAANGAVAALEIKVAETEAKASAAEAAGAEDLEAVRALLAAQREELAGAKARLEEVAARATEEVKAPIHKGAAGAEAAISTVSPLLAGVFPVTIPLLSALAALAGAIKNFTKPRTR